LDDGVDVGGRKLSFGLVFVDPRSLNVFGSWAVNAITLQPVVELAQCLPVLLPF
jgi:hypothetical protein